MMTSPIRGSNSIRIFYSYSHKDRNLREELEERLKGLKRQGLIDEWHDRMIGAGKEWKKAIDENLETSDVILLLVSSSFVASDYCFEKEMKRAMEKHEAGETRVIPVILRPVDWSDTPFSGLQALPRDGKPVVKWRSRDEAWMDVVRGIKEAVESLTYDRRLLKGLKAEKFPGTSLSMTYLKKGAERLHQMIQATKLSNPDLIVGINQGGAALAAMMNKWFQKPSGTIYTEMTVDKATGKMKRIVKFVSLPYEFKSPSQPEKVKPQEILIVDTKLKSGNSIEATHQILQDEYGTEVGIRYAVVLGYGDWKPSRWEIIYPRYPWFVRFVPKNVQVYVAYYTNVDPDNDTIPEPIRAGWGRL